MEKPWMPGLLEALQSPPSEHQPPEKPNPEEKPAPEPASFRSSHASAPRSDNFSFSGGTVSRWSPAKSPLEYDGGAQWNESWADRMLSRAPSITVAVLFLAAIGALTFFYRAQVGQSLVRVGEKISGAPPASSAPASPIEAGPPPASPASQATLPQVSVPPSNSSTASGPSAANAAPVAPPDANTAKSSPAAPDEISRSRSASASLNTRRNQNGAANSAASDAAQSSAEDPSPDSSATLQKGQAEFQTADAALGQARTREAKARAAQLLWTAVSSGSSDAEVELADLYGRGEGVQKNCQQARILLSAARERSNPLVAKEASELRVYGCR
jgi:cytoskeletal protein RodZ